MKQGWISVHRQLEEHWLWQEKPFSKGQAWIDILMLANHADNKFLLGKKLVEVKAGSFITSIEKLKDRWGWSNTKVVNFLDLLESDGMLKRKSDTKKTVITVENYCFYQLSEGAKTMPKRYKNDTETIPKHTINNDNNDNNDNKYIYSSVIEYLNRKANTKYKASSKKTQTCIHSRLSEGFTEDDFKQVIDNKCADWIGTEWEKFLRPETLFGTKFEGYLNAKTTKKPVNTGMCMNEPDPLEGLF